MRGRLKTRGGTGVSNRPTHSLPKEGDSNRGLRRQPRLEQGGNRTSREEKQKTNGMTTSGRAELGRKVLTTESDPI